MTNPSATVIVPTYNRAELLVRSLRALLAQAPHTPPYEVVVVDDSSREDVAGAVGALGADPRLRYVRHDVNRGLSATRNTGVREARGEIVLFVDNDVVVEPGYVAAHLRAHAAAGRGTRVAVVGDLRFPPEVVASSNYAKYLQSRYLGGRPPDALARLDPADLHPRFLIGAVCSIRREDLLAVGMYDETMRFYGCEDHLLAQALRRSGVRIVFQPDARALHYDSVQVRWYRAKMHETARDGVPVLLRHAPEFVAETGFADLLPVDWSRDPMGRIARKLALRAALNPVTVRALETWAAATDRVSWLYLPAVGRALSAAWFLQGCRMAANGPRLVQYGA